MIFKNVTLDQLNEALETVNERYDGNVIWNREPEPVGRRYRATLRVKSSKAPGARRSHMGRRMVSACWHVHGHFFDALIDINPDAVIQTNGSHTVDRKRGSYMTPMYFSEACDC